MNGTGPSPAVPLRFRFLSETLLQAGYATRWAPEFGGRKNGFQPPENNELVLSIKMGCADAVPVQSKPNTPF